MSSDMRKLNVDIATRLVVPDDMAERCLRILEMWQDDNPDKEIEETRAANGKVQFAIRNRHGES